MPRPSPRLRTGRTSPSRQGHRRTRRVPTPRSPIRLSRRPGSAPKTGSRGLRPPDRRRLQEMARPRRHLAADPPCHQAEAARCRQARSTSTGRPARTASGTPMDRRHGMPRPAKAVRPARWGYRRSTRTLATPGWKVRPGPHHPGGRSARARNPGHPARRHRTRRHHRRRARTAGPTRSVRRHRTGGSRTRSRSNLPTRNPARRHCRTRTDPGHPARDPAIAPRQAHSGPARTASRPAKAGRPAHRHQVAIDLEQFGDELLLRRPKLARRRSGGNLRHSSTSSPS